MQDQRMLIILDLDETLIHTTPEPSSNLWAFEYGFYKVFLRPGLSTFLEGLKEHFKVAVWSSASDDYVQFLVEKIFPEGYPLEFVWGRSRCGYKSQLAQIERMGYYDNHHLHFIKPLKKVKRAGFGRLERMLIIDDTPTKATANYGNAIYPEEFTGDLRDRELECLFKYLVSIKDLPNVRKVEKRDWHRQVGC